MRARALKPGEVRKIVARLPPADALWFEIGCVTGLRISEILSLTWKDVLASVPYTKYGQKRTPGAKSTLDITSRVFLDKNRMKGKRHGRIVWLPARTRKLIALACPNTTAKVHWRISPGQKLFPISRTTAWRRIKKVFGALGISPHSLRKTFATRTYGVLKDVLLTSIVLGHQDWKNTLKYIEGLRECDLWKKLQCRAPARPKPRTVKIGYQRPKPKRRHSNSAASGASKNATGPNTSRGRSTKTSGSS